MLIAEVVPPPAIPGVAFGIATLGLVLLYLVCMGMAQAWKQTLGAAFRWIASHIDAINVRVPVIHKTIGLGALADVFRDVDDNVFHAFGWAALQASHGFTYCANQAAASFRHMAHEIEALALGGYRAWTHFVTVYLPRYEKRLLRLAGHGALVLAHGVKRALLRDLNLLHRIVRSVSHHASHATAVADHALDWARARTGRLEKRLDRQSARLEGLREHFGALAFAGLVSAALARLGLKWLRCSNTKKAAKHVCGMDANLLDSLIADATLIVGAVSLVELCRELQDVTELAERGIQGLIREA